MWGYGVEETPREEERFAPEEIALNKTPRRLGTSRNAKPPKGKAK